GWPASTRPVLRPGCQGTGEQLRERLATSADLNPVAAAARRGRPFEASLAEGVRRFQARHGLHPDGWVGPATLTELNAPVERRIDQLRINLDRLRQVAQDLGSDYLLVDLVGMQASLHLAGRVVWSSRLEVGQRYLQTPSFRATLMGVVLNPSWTVPAAVARDALLPRLAQRPEQLRALGLKVVDGAGQELSPSQVDWPSRRGESFPYALVQPPGPGNPLGRLKFLLPNAHSVFLHDIPAKRGVPAGNALTLALAQTCIGIERPHELAVLLLDQPGSWSLNGLRDEIERGDTRTVPARRKVPVLLLNVTARVDERGVARFLPDRDGSDARALDALRRPFRPDPSSPASPARPAR
ncbi:L,D-transpeptidase family protein, partial [Aquabacterium sp. A7-Y]|uniref:L,D-transpeptidase family protein n=1 Tax=Aquabacterium sp. A7-Y TaxID=1349605 RepID=UPI00223CF71A